jgi:hypothetical protein
MGGIDYMGYYDFCGALAFKEPSSHFDHLSFRSDPRSVPGREPIEMLVVEKAK